ncbi:MAG: TonB-dependent receptor [Chitinophagaceae bacterium]|nr:TonB-dependent receptor [Chitinophagaceae bacterium]
MRKLLALLTAFLFFTGQLFAQKTVTGKVTDDKGNPIPNASVMVKGTNTGTITKVDGTYSITVPANAKALVFTAVDMSPLEVILGSQTTVSPTLKPVESVLAEVVVVGYGTQRRKDVTSAISSIGGDKIRNIPVQSFEQALTGKAAGLNVTIPNGVLNNPPVVRIRGVNSISGTSFPLVVVDGVPVISGDASTNLSANNALGNINPADIESIEVLKDASAAAIYGSRAANGVMLITTKKGKQGKAKVTYDVWAGWTEAFNVFDVLNAQEYVTLKNEAVRNGNYLIPASALIPGSGLTPPPAGSPLFFLDSINGQPIDTRWADYIYQTGFQHSHNLSVSGANQGTRYYLSANYTKQEGILQTNTFDRKQMRMNLEQKVNDWLKVGGNFSFSRGSTQSPSSGSLPGTPFSTAGSARLAFVTAPNVAPYRADGRYNIVGIDDPVARNNFNQTGRNKNYDRSGFYNPVMIRDLNVITSQSDQILGDINAEVKLYKGLTYRIQYGVNYLSVDDRTFYNSLHGDGIQTTSTSDDGTAFNAFGKYNVVNFQNTINYDTRIKNSHNLNVLIGSEEQSSKSDRWSAKRSGLTENFYNEFQGGYTLNDNPNANALTENYLLSFFGRVNYNYKNRYFIAGNFRRDGYSAFAEGKKWGNFGGGSVGWNISDESFWGGGISKIVNSLRIRGSYGTVGNLTAVGNFSSLSTFSSFQYGAGYPTLFFSQAGNQDLTWESSTKLDVGLQFGLFDNRITGEIGYYKTDLEDLIIDVPTPPSMGIPGNTISANAASMYNKGIELNITAKVLEKKDMGWDVTFNLTTQKNRVTSLAPGVPEIVGTTQLERTNITRIGQPIGSFFLIRTNGVDPATGRRIFVDAQGREVLFDFSLPAASRYQYRDGTNAPAVSLGGDGYVAGNALPTVYGGLLNTFYYKGFDVNIDAIYSFGNKVYFGSRAGLLDMRFWNNDKIAMTRWQKPGDVTEIPKVVYNDNISNGSAAPLDANLFSGAFVRFRSIALGYTIPANVLNKVNISSIRVYVQAQNPFIITNYPGVDPEISVNGNSALTPGVDRNTIGQARTLTLGLNIGF